MPADTFLWKIPEDVFIVPGMEHKIEVSHELLLNIEKLGFILCYYESIPNGVMIFGSLIRVERINDSSYEAVFTLQKRALWEANQNSFIVLDDVIASQERFKKLLQELLVMHQRVYSESPYVEYDQIQHKDFIELFWCTLFSAPTLSRKEKIEIFAYRAIDQAYQRCMEVLLAQIEVKMGSSKTIASSKKFAKKQVNVASNDIQSLRDSINQSYMPMQVKSRILEEIDKMQYLSKLSQDYGHLHAYIDYVLSLPWKEHEIVFPSFDSVSDILEQSHYGLLSVKEAILDYLSAFYVNGKNLGGILCFSGPPGTGKTSIAKMIAVALNRPFTSISLAGVHDEAYLYGHRRSYMGAMPGKIIQAIKSSKSLMPVILLDEVDKMIQSRNADPMSVLLDILDDQNRGEFMDHYLDIPIDLTKVIFILTLNDLTVIPDALISRLENISFNGYTYKEKENIFYQNILPEIQKKLRISHWRIDIKSDAFRWLVQEYTDEFGVRQLSLQTERLCKKLLRKHFNNYKEVHYFEFLTAENLYPYLKPMNRRTNFKHLARGHDAPVVMGSTAVIRDMNIYWVIVDLKIQEKNRMKDLCTGLSSAYWRESLVLSRGLLSKYLLNRYLEDSWLEQSVFHLHISGLHHSSTDNYGLHLLVIALMMSTKYDTSLLSQTFLALDFTLWGLLYTSYSIRELILMAERGQCDYIIIPKSEQMQWEALEIELSSSVEPIFCSTVFDVLDFLFSSAICKS